MRYAIAELRSEKSPWAVSVWNFCSWFLTLVSYLKKIIVGSTFHIYYIFTLLGVVNLPARISVKLAMSFSYLSNSSIFPKPVNKLIKSFEYFWLTLWFWTCHVNFSPCTILLATHGFYELKLKIHIRKDHSSACFRKKLLISSAHNEPWFCSYIALVGCFL